MGYSTKTGGRSATSGVIPGQYALSVGNPETELPVGWKWTRLTDVARLETGHTPSRKHPEYWDGDVPWLGIKDAGAHHGRVIEDTIQHTNQLGLANSSARLLPTGTVCLSRTASVGYVTVMGRPMCTSQDFVNWVCGPELHRDWLKYILLLEQKALLIFAHGSTHQTIYFPEVKAFHVALPPIEEQVQRLRILQALDAKIELNRRQNETLEAMAQALFKSWFVDFDPVIDNALEAGHDIPEPLRARAERRRAVLASGQYPRLDAEVRSLFPDRFVWQEALGKWCPEGWEVKIVSNLASINPESWTSKKHPTHIEYLDLSGASSGRITNTTAYIWQEAPSRAKRIVRLGDLAFGLVRPGNRSFAIIDRPDLTASTGFAVVRAKEGYWQEFLNLLLTQDDSIDHFAHVADGGAYPAIRPDVVSEFQFMCPSTEVTQMFNRRVQCMRDMRIASNTQTATLASLRDLLLGELIR